MRRFPPDRLCGLEGDKGHDGKPDCDRQLTGACLLYTSEQHEHSVYPRVLWTTPDTVRTQQLRKVFGRQTCLLYTSRCV